MQTTFAAPNDIQKKPPVSELGFGKHFTDHMLTIKWTLEKGWEDPQIGPLVPFQMHPGSKVCSKCNTFLHLLNCNLLKNEYL